MSAEVLRQAARTMREVASTAAAQTQTDAKVEGVWLNGRFHLAWHPTVALAVADWLEQMARGMAGTSYGDLPFEDAALAVARAYLGDT